MDIRRICILIFFIWILFVEFGGFQDSKNNVPYKVSYIVGGENFGVESFTFNEQWEKDYKSVHTPNLNGLRGIKTGIYPIPADLAVYLKQSNNYGVYFNANKKFAIYFTGMDCPYGQMFLGAVESLINSHKYQQYYNFLAKNAVSDTVFFEEGSDEDKRYDSDKERFFHSLCSSFCIVNPNIREVFYIEGVGQNEADKIDTVFSNLRNW